MPFTGLPKDFFDFFEELKANNNRLWFEDNKPRFRASVQEPIADFIEDMAPRLKKISKHFVANPKLNGGSVFRIYRDVRFSKDKTPYKTHGAVQFRHALGKDAHAPGFYVHLSTEEIRVGGGLWTPPAPSLLRIRESIRDHPKQWEKLLTNPDFIQKFEKLDGDRLKRPPRGFDPDHIFIEDLKRKSFFVSAPIKRSMAYKKAFLDEAENAMICAKPIMRFLCKAVDVPF